MGPAPTPMPPTPASVEEGPPPVVSAPEPPPNIPIDAPAPVPVAEPECPLPPNPKGCPAEEPNVNALCAKKKLECVYRGGCCPSPVYACVKAGRELRFEARFYRCE